MRADEGFQSFRDKITKFEGVKTAKAPAGFLGELRNYQKEGLTWLRFLEESLGLWGAWLLWLGWSVALIGLYLNGRKGRGTTARRPGGRTGMQHDKGGVANGRDQT